MKKVLITGAGGFIGSHLAEKCVELGCEVKALIRYNSRNDWGWLETSRYKHEIEVVPGDVRELDSVVRAMKDRDTVFHLAALIGIPYSYISPLAYVRTNVEGTLNVLETAKTLNTPNILITSTSETYGSAQYVPIDENHSTVGQSPYSASKIAADQLALSFYHSFDLPVKVVKPFNTYGPRQSARAFIPTVILQILDGKSGIRLGHTRPTRDLTFVTDTANGFVEIAKCDNAVGEVMNIGMNREISMLDLAKKIGKLMEKEIEVIEDASRLRPENSEVERLRCDNRKLLKDTTWKPGYDLDSGLTETIAWYAEHKGCYKANLYNI
jgi:dTDP-glucose 4,6-dehydratase